MNEKEFKPTIQTGIQPIKATFIDGAMEGHKMYVYDPCVLIPVDRNKRKDLNDIMYQYRGCQDYNDDGSESFIFEGYTTFARMLKQVEPVSKIEALKGEIK